MSHINEIFSKPMADQRLTDVDLRTQSSFFWAVYPPVFLLLGALFHAYHVRRLLRQRRSGENVFLAFAFLAVVDCLALATSMLHFWLRVNFKVNVRAMSLGGCRFHLWLSRLSQDVPPWVLVLMTYEKRAFLWYPVPANSQFSRPTLKAAFLGLLSLSTLRNLDVVSYQLVLEPRAGSGRDVGEAGSGSDVGDKAGNGSVECALPDTASAVYLRLFTPWMDFFFQGLGPFVCLFVYNAFVVRKIRLERRCAERLMQKVGIAPPFWLSVGLTEARNAVQRTGMLTLIMFSFELPSALYDIIRSLSAKNTASHQHTWQLMGTMLHFSNYAWLYAVFSLQDHYLLVTLRDTWRGPLVKKRGTNVASTPPRLLFFPPPRTRATFLARLLRTRRLPTRWLKPFSWWRRESGVQPADPHGGILFSHTQRKLSGATSRNSPKEAS